MKAPTRDLLRRWEAQSSGTRLHRQLEALRYGRAAGEPDEASRFVLELQDPHILHLRLQTLPNLKSMNFSVGSLLGVHPVRLFFNL